MTISSLLLLISMLIMTAQISGIQAAANTVVTVSCAHPDDDAPNYENGPFRYKDNLGWEDDKDKDKELEITHSGGGVGDIAAHTCQYITCPGSAIWVHVLNCSQRLLTSTQSYSQESQSSFAGEGCSPQFVHAQLDKSDGSSCWSVSGMEGRGVWSWSRDGHRHPQFWGHINIHIQWVLSFICTIKLLHISRLHMAFSADAEAQWASKCCHGILYWIAIPSIV